MILLISCARQFQSSMPSSKGPSTYCSLLHVTGTPYVPVEPKPFLGIQYTSKKISIKIPPYNCEEAIQILWVIDDTSADNAGMRENDIILSLNSQPICIDKNRIIEAFREKINQQKIDSQVEFDILREGQLMHLSATLKEKPVHYMKEARHDLHKECREDPSLLENALNKQGLIKSYNEILSGLYERSNYIHNPEWFYKKRFNPFQLSEFTYMIRYPLTAGSVTADIANQLTGHTNKGHWSIYEIIKKLENILDTDSSFQSSQIDVTFPELVKTIQETEKRIDRILSVLSEEEKSFLRKNILNPMDNGQANRLLEISIKIDLKDLLSSFHPLLLYLNDKNIAILKEDLLNRFSNHKGGILYEDMTSAGKIIVGGTGSNTYNKDAALILDLGGNDTYLNNAGGTRDNMPVTLLIDWEGNDRYLTKENFSHGSGMLGGGFLLDLEGDDIFTALDGNQGAGFFGIGILFNSGRKSTFNARGFSQGIGQVGIGLLYNDDEDSIYRLSHRGQALGLYGGEGLIVDEKGDDTYILGGYESDFRDPEKSTVSIGQGFGNGIRPEKEAKGASGGIGILIDRMGNDNYIADYFAQGSSYFYGIGILHVLSGDDNYISGRYSQGAGIHSSVGILIDNNGDDYYHTAYGVAQGMGHDYGVGFLEDMQGDDYYSGGTLVQGAATHGGIGILIDREGQDSYICKEKGQAFAQDKECIGILINQEPSRDFSSIYEDILPIKIGIANH